MRGRKTMKKMYLEQNIILLFFLNNNYRKPGSVEDIFRRHTNKINRII
jgi:hypothetical protein